MNQKRLSVPLLPEIENIIDELSELTDNSKSQILLGLQIESIDHLKLKSIMARYLRNKGFKVKLEPEVKGDRPDLVAEKEDKSVLVECLTSPSELSYIRKISKYVKYTDNLYFAIPKGEYNRNNFIGLGVKVFLCNLNENKIEKKIQFDFDAEIFNEKMKRDSAVMMSCRLAPKLIESLEELVGQGHYRNKTEAINDAIRLLREKYLTINSDLRAERKSGKK